MLDLVWDRVYHIPLPPFPLHPLADPPAKSSKPSFKTPKPNHLSGRALHKPRTQSLHKGHFGLLWETWCLAFGVLGLGFGVLGLGFAVLELGFVVLALKP